MKLFRCALLILFGFAATGQEVPDSIAPITTSRSVNFLLNRTLINSVDNPALTGIERSVVIEQTHEGNNLGYSDLWKSGGRSVAFQTHGIGLEVPFGKKRNWAMGFRYQYNQDGWFHRNHDWILHSSKTFEFRSHLLAIGASLGYTRYSLQWDRLTFPDMIDPRFGFVYPTLEPYGSASGASALHYSIGVHYQWKGLTFDASTQYGPTDLYTFYNYTFDPKFYYLGKLGYRIQLGHNTTLNPEFMVRRDRLFEWRMTPALSLSYRQLVFFQLAATNLNEMTLNLGIGVPKTILFTLGSSYYLGKENQEILGVASLNFGIRTFINTKPKL